MRLSDKELFRDGFFCGLALKNVGLTETVKYRGWKAGIYTYVFTIALINFISGYAVCRFTGG
jgi:hypothetical protein